MICRIDYDMIATNYTNEDVDNPGLLTDDDLEIGDTRTYETSTYEFAVSRSGNGYVNNSWFYKKRPVNVHWSK